MNDENIRKQIGSLDTLSGGIVFGKEEAWEKLQARMEQKPTRKITLKLSLAAAAVLLILVCSLSAYYNAGKDTTTNIPATTVQPNNNSRIELKTESAVQQNGPLVTKKQPAITGKKQTIAVKEYEKKQADHSATDIGVVIVAAPEIIPDTMASITLPTAIAIREPMKTVHINDLENNNGNSTPITVNTVQQIDMSKMKVVHINDVERQETEFRKILLDSRAAIGLRGIFKPGHNLIEPGPEGYYQPHNLQKNMLNAQN